MIQLRMQYLKKISALIAVVLLCSGGLPQQIFAAELSVTPVVVDDKARIRDILKRSITIQNTSNRKLDIYPTVNDVRPEDGTAPFVSAQNADDRADSLANWIEISRGMIEISPGEEKTIPFVVRVAPNAVPGTYHASITLGAGSDRGSAEASPPLGTVTINVEVGEDIKEFLQLNKFTTDRLFFSGDDVLFKYQIENIGNQELQPKGEIRIYDRKGEEVASVDVNADSKKFSPDQTLQLASVWSGARGFGKYKAFLTVDYGSSQLASVQDTVYFWIVPWQQLFALLVAALVAVVALALYYHRWLEEKHRVKFGLPVVAHHAPEAVLGDSVSTEGPSMISKVVSGAAQVFSSLASMMPVREKSESKVKSITDMPDFEVRKSLREATAQQPIIPREVTPSIPLVQNHGEVINLKHIRHGRDEVPAQHQVIDLKKRS